MSSNAPYRTVLFFPRLPTDLPPVRANENSSIVNLIHSENLDIKPGMNRVALPYGVTMPPFVFGLLRIRPGPFRQTLLIMNDVISTDLPPWSNILFYIFNMSEHVYRIHRGESLCQMYCLESPILRFDVAQPTYGHYSAPRLRSIETTDTEPSTATQIAYPTDLPPQAERSQTQQDHVSSAVDLTQAQRSHD